VFLHNATSNTGLGNATAGAIADESAYVRREAKPFSAPPPESAPADVRLRPGVIVKRFFLSAEAELPTTFTFRIDIEEAERLARVAELNSLLRR